MVVLVAQAAHRLAGHLAATALLPAGARMPAWGSPLILGLALVLLISIPWVLAVARRLANPADSATQLPARHIVDGPG